MNLNLGSQLEADSLALVHVKVDSVLTPPGGWWGTLSAGDSGHCQAITIGLALASVDHKVVRGSGLVSRVGWVVRAGGQGCLTLGPVTHEPRGP